MRICHRCGKTLPENETIICSACGAVQKAVPVQPAVPSADHLEKGADANETFADEAAPAGAFRGAAHLRAPAEINRHKAPQKQDAEDMPRRKEHTGASFTEPAPTHMHSPYAQTNEDTQHAQTAVRPGASARRARGVMAQTATPPPRVQRAQNKALRVLGVIALVLVLLLAAAGFATNVLYQKYNAPAAFTALGDALLTQDIPKLKTLMTGDGIAVTSEGLAALCKLFTTQESADALVGQLTALSAGETPASLPYPTVRPASKKVFLGYARHTVLIGPAALRVPAAAAAPGFALQLDGKGIIGEKTDDGILYAGLFPGVYEATVTAQTLLGDTIAGPAATVTLTDTAVPALLESPLPMATVTVENCLSDTAAITVNDKAVEQKPVNGVLTLPNLGVGSTITMTLTTEYGAKTTATVVFADKAAAALKFENHATEGGIPTEEALNTLLAGWFASYLDACNNADPTRMQSCTELVRGLMTAEITGEEMKKSSFSAKTTQVAIASVQQASYETLPALLMNVKFVYSATDRASAQDSEKTSLYTIELVWQEGWKVNRAAPLTEEFFAANTFATLPT